MFGMKSCWQNFFYYKKGGKVNLLFYQISREKFKPELGPPDLQPGALVLSYPGSTSCSEWHVISRGFEGELAVEPGQLNGRAPGQRSGGPSSGLNFSLEI